MEQEMGLGSIARSVLAQYDVNPVDIKIIQQGGIKAVWRVKTEEGTLALKRLKQSWEKALFSVGAQCYIKGKGGNVAGIIENKVGNPITDFNGQLFVLYEWIDGNHLNFDNKEDFAKAMEGLARFHSFSKGYEAPEGARISTKIGKWPNQYRSMINRLRSWKTQAELESGISVYDSYRKWAEPMITLGEKALGYLEESCYGELSNTGSTSVVLCHQDYGKGNALSTSEGIYVLDLDGVTFELPARDLRKIILKTMESQGRWDEKVMQTIISWYEKGNPLSPDDKRMVYIDALFPHGFHGTVKNKFLKNKEVKPSSIEKIGALEQSKEEILERLLKGGAGN